MSNYKVEGLNMVVFLKGIDNNTNLSLGRKCNIGELSRTIVVTSVTTHKKSHRLLHNVSGAILSQIYCNLRYDRKGVILAIKTINRKAYMQ